MSRRFLLWGLSGATCLLAVLCALLIAMQTKDSPPAIDDKAPGSAQDEPEGSDTVFGQALKDVSILSRQEALRELQEVFKDVKYSGTNLEMFNRQLETIGIQMDEEGRFHMEGDSYYKRHPATLNEPE